MYYCPNCKKKFRQYRRRCPYCSTPCRHHDNRLIILIIFLAALFLGLIILAITITGPKDSEETAPSGGSSAPLTSSAASSVPASSELPGSSAVTPSSSVPSGSIPTQPTVPPTQPTTQPATQPVNPGPSGIGLYTRAELEALDSTYPSGGFGAGRAPNHARPSIPVAEQNKYGKYDAYFIGEDTNVTYLTFDCGYEYYTTVNGQRKPVTAMILDVLRDKGVKAVFFVTMDYVKAEPALVQRMIDEGHAVGNHTVNHPVMPAQSIDTMEKEVMDLHNYVLEKYGYRMTLFRPPTGAYSIQSLAVVRNLGYKTVLWSFQYLDYETGSQPSEKSAYNTITNNTHNGTIFLLHAVSTTNAAVLDDVIDYLCANNYAIELFS